MTPEERAKALAAPRQWTISAAEAEAEARREDGEWVQWFEQWKDPATRAWIAEQWRREEEIIWAAWRADALERRRITAERHRALALARGRPVPDVRVNACA